MALANYTELVDALGKWSKRTDLAALMPSFILLAETRIRTMLNERLQDAAQVLYTVPGDASVLLPSELLHVRSISIPGTAPALTYITPDQYNALTHSGGAPRQYTIVGQQILLSPVPDATYSLSITLAAEFPALSEAAPVNALLTRWPNLYLWGPLVEAMKYAEKLDTMAVYDNDFQAAIAAVNLLSWKTPGALRVQTDVRY